MLCRNNDKSSAFSLEYARNAKIAHIHITIIQEIIRLLVVIFTSGYNFFFIKRTLGRGSGPSLAQIKNSINDLIYIIARDGRVCPHSANSILLNSDEPVRRSSSSMIASSHLNGEK